ncbi:MAG TPA: cation:proton antiporter [Candidatus Limnocylindria bacterium]
MTGGLGLTFLAALGVALLLGAVAHRLRMAPMIGYIAAGLVVGPFSPGFVANRDEVLALADIGVALLMFSIGVRFSLAKLQSVGRLVLIGAPLQVAFSIALGAGIAFSIGRPVLESLFLGAIASVCSSVVLVKVAGETSLETTAHGKLALAWSIMQDLLTVVLVVVLGALAGGGEEPALEAVRATVVALAVVAAVLVVGSRVLPGILSRIAQLGSRELFVVAVAVLAIGTATLAAQLGVSVALGAFVAGMALAESDLAASVLGEVVPLRELFATIFFVSIGILLEPAAVIAGWPTVLLLIALIVAGKGVAVAAISLAGRQRPRTALRAAGLVAQGGEFSFVLAAVGLQLGALGQDTFSQAMGAIVATVVIAAPVAGLSARLGDRLELRFPVPPLPGPAEPAAGMRRHVVILGYGHVGKAVARVLEGRGFPWVAADADYAMVHAATTGGAPLVYGDAGTPSVLDALRVADAGTLVVTVPDALAARQAIEYALRHNPNLHVVVRAHSAQDEAELRRLGAARIVTAEREIGHELVRHALRRYGVSDQEIAAILRRGDQGVRPA